MAGVSEEKEFGQEDFGQKYWEAEAGGLEVADWKRADWILQDPRIFLSSIFLSTSSIHRIASNIPKRQRHTPIKGRPGWVRLLDQVAGFGIEVDLRD